MAISYEDKRTVVESLRAIRSYYSREEYLDFIYELRNILDVQERVCMDVDIYNRVTKDEKVMKVRTIGD